MIVEQAKGRSTVYGWRKLGKAAVAAQNEAAKAQGANGTIFGHRKTGKKPEADKAAEAVPAQQTIVRAPDADGPKEPLAAAPSAPAVAAEPPKSLEPAESNEPTKKETWNQFQSRRTKEGANALQIREEWQAMKAVLGESNEGNEGDNGEGDEE